MTGAEHYAEAQQRIRASDYHWQDAHDAMTATGALREAVVAQTHAMLALAAAQGANRCADRDTFDQRCHLEAGHAGLHSVPLTAEKAWPA